MELDFKKSCSSGLSPNTVLPQRRLCSNTERRNSSGKFTREDYILRVKEGFTEISFRRYRSSSCKNVASKPLGLEGNIEQKRGSIYQSSREVRQIKKMDTNDGRKKIELSRASDTSFSFRIVDSLCSSDEENSLKISPEIPVESGLERESPRKPCVEPSSSDGFIEICPTLEEREKQSSGTVQIDSAEGQAYKCEQLVDPIKDCNSIFERDMALRFHKSLSAKVEMHRSPSSPSPEYDSSARTSSRSRFRPIRKMLDPFMKSKSQRSPLGLTVAPGDIKATSAEKTRNQMLRKSLLHDFSSAAQKLDFDPRPVKQDIHNSTVASSPVHLQGCLKLENKHGVPCFEFSLNCREEVLVAKTWKGNNAFNWFYSFHSVSGRKKSNATGWGLNDGNKESIVGKMRVSCHLSSELKEGVVFDDSMVTEFVLHDIEHARQSLSAQDSTDVDRASNSSNSGLADGKCELEGGSQALKLKHQSKLAFHKSDFDFSDSRTWPSAVLHPDLEIAAIVIQIPFAKRESLKYKRGDKSRDKMQLNLLNLSTSDQMRKNFPDRESQEKVKVVIPAGNHSLPSNESEGPSSLLHRWRTGGDCDCGGWDMACHLTVLGNPDIQCSEDEALINKQRPLEFFLQGGKEKMPAFRMTIVEEGRYTVDFHARLSSLQAFSICVAILHGTVASTVAGEERSKPLVHSNSLKVLIEEEVKFLIETVTEEEKRKAYKKVEEIQHRYVVNPPFSPIARV